MEILSFFSIGRERYTATLRTGLNRKERHEDKRMRTTDTKEEDIKEESPYVNYIKKINITKTMSGSKRTHIIKIVPEERRVNFFYRCFIFLVFIDFI